MNDLRLNSKTKRTVNLPDEIYSEFEGGEAVEVFWYKEVRKGIVMKEKNLSTEEIDIAEALWDDSVEGIKLYVVDIGGEEREILVRADKLSRIKTWDLCVLGEKSTQLQSKRNLDREGLSICLTDFEIEDLKGMLRALDHRLIYMRMKFIFESREITIIIEENKG